jgi:MSHA biogenesis protein MshE
MKQAATRVRVGDLLLGKRLITQEQLNAALSEQKLSGKKVGKALVELGFITETGLLQSLSAHFSYPFVDLARFRLNNDLVRKLPEMQARRYRAIVLSEQKDGYLVGMGDPLDLIALDELEKSLRRPILPAFVREQDLLDAMDRAYRRQDQIASIAHELEGELSQNDFDIANLVIADTTEAPVVRLLQNIFDDALQVRASDIHIEPDESLLRVRLRIDGELQEQVMKEKRIAGALVSRLKIMSGLDISEKRLPQDGRFNVRVQGKSIDVRLSTLPTPYGESVVMRLLDQSSGMLTLESLGMPPAVRQRVETLMQRPHGMVLVTGPTGCGKTTTLYAGLNLLNRPEKKIITVEDPIEYRLPRITQVQVNAKIGLTFSRVLRTALRQDPDIILVGEMRDQETAEIGLRAAMTGHMVLSTLHTNDAVSTPLRLMDMGCDAYLVASALRAVMAQRLIRKVCTSCKAEYHPSAQELTWLSHLDGSAMEAAFVHGTGCHHCNNTGYMGRIGIYELMEMTESMLDALRSRDASAFMQAADASGYVTLARHALEFARAGVSSLQEVFRISASLEDGSGVVEG